MKVFCILQPSVSLWCAHHHSGVLQLSLKASTSHKGPESNNFTQPTHLHTGSHLLFKNLWQNILFSRIFTYLCAFCFVAGCYYVCVLQMTVSLAVWEKVGAKEHNKIKSVSFSHSLFHKHIHRNTHSCLSHLVLIIRSQGDALACCQRQWSHIFSPSRSVTNVWALTRHCTLIKDDVTSGRESEWGRQSASETEHRKSSPTFLVV